MQLIFKQRMFSWFDSYDISNVAGDKIYTVKGQLSWGHCLKIFDANGSEIGMVKQKVITFLPKFEIYSGQHYIGCISKEFSLFKPSFNIDYDGWHVDGDFFEWDYTIKNSFGHIVATVSKTLAWTDTYVIDVQNESDALNALMLVLAIDAEKCSRN